MAVYRFLFAPILLAVAVVAGPRAPEHRAPEPLRAAATVSARIDPAPVVIASPPLRTPDRAVRAVLPRIVAAH
jgi:hypothetical protein